MFSECIRPIVQLWSDNHRAPAPFSPFLPFTSVFVHKGCLLSLMAKKKKKSCLATWSRDCLPSTASPHAHSPLAFHALLCRMPEWRKVVAASPPTPHHDESKQHLRNTLRSGWRDGQERQCPACCLPAVQLLCWKKMPFPLTAPLPLCITKENRVLPQHAVISRTKNTRRQIHHIPAYRHSYSMEADTGVFSSL